MRYQIVNDGKTIVTVPTMEDAVKMIEMLGEGYTIVPILKSEHTARFNQRR